MRERHQVQEVLRDLKRPTRDPAARLPASELRSPQSHNPRRARRDCPVQCEVKSRHVIRFTGRSKAMFPNVATTAQDVVIAGFLALDDDERAVTFSRIRDLWRERLASESLDEHRFLRSLTLVANANGGRMPTVQEYQHVEAELSDKGVQVEPFRRVYRHYGNWPNARAAFEMSGDSTAEMVEYHFRRRRLGKTSRYSEKTLVETMASAVEHWGRPPTVAEYSWWRKKQLAIEQSTGATSPDRAIPNHLVYTSRWNSWEAALEACGYTQEQIASRMEGKAPPQNTATVPYLPEGLPVAHVDSEKLSDAPLPPSCAQALADGYERLPHRTRYVLTVRLGLGGAATRTLSKTGEPLVVSLARAQQIQVEATEALTRSVLGLADASGMSRGEVRELIVESLLAITALHETR